MSEIGVRLTGENSSFRSMMDQSVQQGTAAAGRLATGVTNKLTNLKQVSTSVATALGLNIQSIAENVARFIEGMSKEEEDAYKRSEQLSSSAADASIRNMRARLTEEQRYQLSLTERDRLVEKISATEVKSGKDMVALAELQVQLEQKNSDIIAYETKQIETRKKLFEDELRARSNASEALRKEAMESLTLREREKTLRADILAIEAAINSGKLQARDAELFKVSLDQRRLELARTINDQKEKEIEFNKRAALEETQRLEMFKLEEKARLGLSGMERERLTLLKLQTEEKRIHAQVSDLLTKQVETGLNPAERTRLAELIKQEKKLDDQIAKKQALIAAASQHANQEQRVTKEIQAQLNALNHINDVNHLAENAPRTVYEFDGKKIGPARNAEYFQTLSDSVLQEVVRRNLDLINSLEATKYSSASTGAEAASGFLARGSAQANLQTEIQRANYILNNRKQFRGQDYNAALATFQGDLSKFDQLYNSAQEQTDKLGELNQRLENSGLFPINGPRPPG